LPRVLLPRQSRCKWIICHRNRKKISSRRPVAELARVPTNACNALNSGEFSYEW
jgi:hypothetical protein